MASSTPGSPDMKTRILKRLSLFEPHQNNPPWQVDRIGELASNNSPPILEALKDVRHELFAQLESLPNKPDSFADGSENEDLVVEIQRLRDENASLLRIIEELSQQQKPDDWRTAEKRCTRVNKPPQEVIRTSNRFSPLSTPVSIDIDVDIDSPNEREMSRQETQECPISQQIGMYRRHQRTKFYNTTTQDKTAIIGDSMIKHLKSKKMSRRGNVKCYTHRGARLEQLTAPAQRIVRNETPSTVIVHAGTNNNNEPAHVVTQRAFHLASTLQRSGAKNVAVSGVIMRANGGLEWTRQVNLGIQQMCDKNGWHFIDNNNIGLHHICPDGVHLNRQGTIQLAKNFIGFLNGERQARVRNGTSFADALRAPPPLMSRGFRGRHPDWNMW
ncbi:hypothetical protein Bbelb_200790 [Branchiostoma belcheri]|nr:hypothetical protein Bbelb_200790 [Branchiostoma belcheri]